ncbi:DUF1772 domain-containing protein [Mycobacterium sp. 1274756.6]|uniref:DUF1772 domain-containing protein n=1 Tax=Mycobacterium sp. 1274756.6 TaxID=1834076 RepID=UPI0007FD9C83|nr:DUF1772 domain-containing protein [Mycobacterium sp. 1274756.6]OBJ73087.1 DUF1772 domain-containing protein [Mycobacterium sp. 1274756.6]
MTAPGHAPALVALLGVAVLFGTDMFCAVVLRPALARLDAPALTATAGYLHLYGDRRMPFFGALGAVGAAISAATGLFTGHPVRAMAAGTAVALMVIWLLLYLRVSAPINRALTAAATGRGPAVAPHRLQADWDRVIYPRALLQGLALVALCLTLTH